MVNRRTLKSKSRVVFFLGFPSSLLVCFGCSLSHFSKCSLCSLPLFGRSHPLLNMEDYH